MGAGAAGDIEGGGRLITLLEALDEVADVGKAGVEIGHLVIAGGDVVVEIHAFDIVSYKLRSRQINKWAASILAAAGFWLVVQTTAGTGAVRL